MKPRLSPSQIATFRLCARKWAFSRILPGRSNKYAELGTAVHTALEAWLINGTALDLNTEVGKIAASGMQHLPPPGQCSIESAFKFETTAATYTGRRDMRFVEETAKRLTYREVIGDHKTTSDLKWAKTPAELATDPQGVIYAMSVFIEEPRAKETELRWVYYTTRAPYKSRRVSLVVTYDETIERMKSIDATAIEMAQYGEKPDPKSVPTTPTACEAFGGCPYQVECGLSANERMRAIMSQSALQAKLQERLAAKNGASPKPVVVEEAPTPAPAVASGGSAAEKLAALRARKAAETAAPARAEALESKAAERAVEVAKEVDAEIDAKTKTPDMSPGIYPAKKDPAMTDLRDAMAMSALNGMLARGSVSDVFEDAARDAYRYADAMLEARGG